MEKHAVASGERKMKYDELKATITGVTCEGEPFTETLEFKLLPPDEPYHYGTGYYMRVKMPHSVQLEDVRYARTTDIEILADAFIRGWYGDNAKDVVKWFPEEKEDK